MKWNASNIVKFLEIYENYPILWNIKRKDYLDSKLKDSAFQKLWDELEAEDLLGDMTVKKLKARIKSIRDSYRQELNKIETSKKSGMGTDDIYKPKLVWFDNANFLKEVIATRTSRSNLELELTGNEILSEEAPTDLESPNSPSEISSEIPEQRSTIPQQKRGLSSPPILKRNKRSQAQQKPSGIQTALQELNEIITKVNKQDAFDLFGQYVAGELRDLPVREAILLQQKIQSLIVDVKLSCLPHPSSSSNSRSQTSPAFFQNVSTNPSNTNNAPSFQPSPASSSYGHSVHYSSSETSLQNMPINPSNTTNVPDHSASQLYSTNDLLQVAIRNTFECTENDNNSYISL